MRTVARTKAVVAASEEAASPAKNYIESSALVAALLEGDAEARAAMREAGVCVTSALTMAEASRAVLRARISGRITVEQERAALVQLQSFERHCHIVAVTEEILAHAGRQFPIEPLRTLEAVHLATAQAMGEPPALVTIVTRDIRVRANAIALGHPVE